MLAVGWYCNITDTTIVPENITDQREAQEGGGLGGYTQLLTAHHSANYLVFAIVTNLYYAGILIMIQQIKLQRKTNPLLLSVIKEKESLHRENVIMIFDWNYHSLLNPTTVLYHTSDSCKRMTKIIFLSSSVRLSISCDTTELRWKFN